MSSNKLYLDGCSFTYGFGLEENEKLAYLFQKEGGYEVVNRSRPGKSNSAIALDIHRYSQDCNCIVVGWTFSDRFYLESRGNKMDFLPTRYNLATSDEDIGAEIEDVYTKIHKQLYAIYDNQFYDDVSDLIVTSTYANLIRQGKTVIFFSWENRKTNVDIFYPIVSPEGRLSDGHLNKKSMKKLYEDITWFNEKTK